MSGLQIAALICAIILLLPGGCFLFFGVALEPVLALIGLVILGTAVGLLVFAFRRRLPADASRMPVDLGAGPLAAERARRELRARNYQVKRFLFASRHDVRLPSGERHEFADEAAFLEWARRELS